MPHAAPDPSSCPPRLTRRTVAGLCLGLCTCLAQAGEAVPVDSLVDGQVVEAPPLATVPADAAAEIPVAELLKQGYEPGSGPSGPVSGRFGGRGRSDGLLDWDYPEFGVLEKGYLAAHPANLGQRRWAIGFAPPRTINPAQMAQPYRGDGWGTFWGPEAAGAVIRSTWIALDWESRLTSVGEYLGRGAGVPVDLRVSYSLATPGLLIASTDRALHLDLNETPGYRFAVLPLAGGPTLKRLSPEQPAYDRARDGELADNWILLWGSRLFPDVPLLIVPMQRPQRITPVFPVSRDRCASLIVLYEKQVGEVVLVTPYGMQALTPSATATLPQLREAVSRSRFWSKAVLGFITDCHEDFRLDAAAGSLAIHQRFIYRDLANAWDAKPLHLAPLPPALALAARIAPAVRLPAAATELGFPTRHGPLLAVAGRDSCDYQRPIPPVLGRTPFAVAGASPARDAIRAQHAAPRHDGARGLLPGEFPGLWTRPDRSIADVSAVINEIAFLAPNLDEAASRALRANARDILLDCLDDSAFAGTELARSLARTPADAGRPRPQLWHPRVDPATKAGYLLSYTVPNIRRTGGNITDFPGCFTDCEWGNGLGLWGIYQLARLSGAWEVVRQNWERIHGIEALFEIQQDWAAMSAAGSEGGRRWTDTSCSNGYNAFCELARRSGAQDAWRRGTYLHAKHAALRLALLEYGVWGHDLFGVAPYRVAHMFQEHNRGFPTNHEPGQYREADDRRGSPITIDRLSFYSMVAEGTGYEGADLLYTLAPAAAAAITADYEQAFPEWTTDAFLRTLNTRHMPAGGITLAQMLLFQLRDPAIPTARIRSRLEAAGGPAAIREHLSKRGFYGRFDALPEYIQALLETRDDPAWLADWEGCDLQQAVFDRTTREAA
ncbi:MAG: hypothetical protein HY859_10600, partial [Caulobacterales bacterium]|nr:hypothetical protein [Caulobacterales bacterium]